MVFFYNALAQEKIDNKINQFNNKGRKEGFWTVSSRNGIIESYYKDGILSGLYKEYTLQGRLLIFGEYQADKRSGIWYFFNNKGLLEMLFKDFMKNTFSIINEGDK